MKQRFPESKDPDEKIVDIAFEAGRRYEREKVKAFLAEIKDPRVLGGLKSTEESYGKHI